MTALEAVPNPDHTWQPANPVASQARHGWAVWTREQGPLPPSVACQNGDDTTPTAPVKSVLFTGLPKEQVK